MDTKNQKKMYVLFIAIVAVLLIVSALVGAAIAIHFNNKEDTSAPAISGDVVTTPTLNVENPTGNTVEIPTSNATVDPSNNIPTIPAGVEQSTTMAPTEAADEADKVGPYAVGYYYVAKTDGKNLRLRASASAEVDTGVEIPANAKLNITQIIASDDPAYPYWGATTYGSTDGYVAMQFLTDAATFEASNPNPTTNAANDTDTSTAINLDNIVGNYSAGSYTVNTGGYGGVKVKTEPGDGDGLQILADGEVVEVLDVQKWDEATAEDTVYWGHIQWQGWDAYVPMYYLDKNA